MKIEDIHSRLVDEFGDAIKGIHTEAKDPWIEVQADAIARIARYLKEDDALKLDGLNDLSAVDYCEPDEKKAAKFEHDPHLEVVYHLYSYTHKHFCTIKVNLPRWQGGVAGETPECPSVAGVWAIADWHEREAYDLMGIRFTNHPNLVRILCPDDWVGHPLRKDYEFPLEYHGIRGM